MDFNQKTATMGNSELLPIGTLAKAIFSWDEVGYTKPNPEKNTQGGGMYLKGKLTISEGPFARRTIFHNLFNPEDQRNSEGARTMGMGQLVRMLESAGVFNPADPSSYRSMSFQQAMDAIVRRQGQGGFIGIETGIQKGTGGYQDKAVVRNFLCPNPKSDSFGKWKKLMEGGGGAPAAPAGGAFGMPAAQRPAAPPVSGGFPQTYDTLGAPQAPMGTGAPGGWLASGQMSGTAGDDIPF